MFSIKSIFVNRYHSITRTLHTGNEHLFAIFRRSSSRTYLTFDGDVITTDNRTWHARIFATNVIPSALFGILAKCLAPAGRTNASAACSSRDVFDSIHRVQLLCGEFYPQHQLCQTVISKRGRTFHTRATSLVSMVGSHHAAAAMICPSAHFSQPCY